jgi:ATP-dependent RNA helicase DDX1
MKVPMNDFDGKVVYGEKVKSAGSGYKDHVNQLVPIVKSLCELETASQKLFLKRMKLY